MATDSGPSFEDEVNFVFLCPPTLHTHTHSKTVQVGILFSMSFDDCDCFIPSAKKLFVLQLLSLHQNHQMLHVGVGDINSLNLLVSSVSPLSFPFHSFYTVFSFSFLCYLFCLFLPFSGDDAKPTRVDVSLNPTQPQHIYTCSSILCDWVDLGLLYSKFNFASLKAYIHNE